MPFDIFSFVLDKITAAQQGVNDQRSTELGLIGAILPLGPIPSLVITQVIARNEAGSGTPVAAPPDTGSSSGQAQQVQVPDVKSQKLSFDLASAMLQSLQLQAVRQDVLSTTAPKDRVIDQAPAPLTIVPAGTQVILSVNPGVKVPDVTKQTLENAKSQLGLLGLGFDTTEKPSEDVDPGLVLSQNPAPGTLGSPTETVVHLKVSSGVPLVDLPDVVHKSPTENYDFDEAREILQDLDFIVIPVPQAVSENQKDLYGKVLKQDPAPGKYPHEIQVTLTFGVAPSQV